MTREHTTSRRVSWLDHMREHADSDGVWWNSRPARDRLPNRKYIADGTVQQIIRKMCSDGYIIRVAHSGYVASGTQPHTEAE